MPPLPERMTVSLATEVGLDSTSPDPVAESRAAIAPTLSDDTAARADRAGPARTDPGAVAPSRPRRPPRAAPTRTAAQPRAGSRPARDRSAQTGPTPRQAGRASGGGSRIGDDFLEGAGTATATTETRVPAWRNRRRARKASLSQAITRQLRPHWTAPPGVDAEKLVTILSFGSQPRWQP